LLTIRDLTGVEEALTGFKGFERNRKVNGEKTISMTILPTRDNQHAFPLVKEESIITYNDEEYVIKQLSERNNGRTYVKQVTAIHKFFVDMIDKQQPNVHNGSITFVNFLSFVFDGTGYSYSVIDNFNAETFENLGDENRLAILQTGLERYQAEMEIVGNNVRFRKLVGNNTDFQFRYGHNVKTIERNVDTSNLATRIKGYGKLKEEIDVLSGVKIPYKSRSGTYYTETGLNQLATDQVGANFKFTFAGTGFNFDTILTFLGGIWEFTIDGTHSVKISTYKDVTSENKTFEIARGLENKTHNVTATFKGKDSNNPYTKDKNVSAIGYLKSGEIIGLYRELAGDEQYMAVVEYTSPNASIFGIKDSPPFSDERYTTNATLLEAMKKSLQDTPEVSFTIDFADLRAAGYPWTVPNEGDRVFIIYEPLNDLELETRLLEINETLNEKLEVIKTNVTLSNYKKTFAGTMFNNIDKRLKTIVDDNGKIKYNVLDEAVQIATKALLSAQTELEFNNGIIAREKTDPNKLVLYNSAGLGISTNGGETFNTAITAEGIVADVITSGILNANNILVTGILTGALLQTATSGKRVKIQAEDYAALEDETQKISLGFRQLSAGVPEAPRFAMGIRGMNTASMNADGSYFVATHYPAEDNPMMNGLSYMDLAYACTQAGAQSGEDRYSNIKFFDDGVMRLAPVKELHITTNYVNGSFDPFGEKTIATFGSSTSQYFNSHMAIGAIVNRTNAYGLILGDDVHEPYTRVRIETDTEGGQYLRPLTSSGSIQLGSPSFPWESVFAVNGTIQSSSYARKSDIHQVLPADSVEGTKTPTSITTEDAIDFIHNLKTYTYVYKKGEEYIDENGELQTRLVDRTIEEALFEEDLVSIQLGIIADEHINNPMAHFILSGKNETLGVQVMSALTAAIITIQDQEKRIKALEAKGETA
jgi:hypothetical protein